MKNIANYISISRIVMSIVLLAMKVLTIPFWVIYMYCGISDMLDGYIARKYNYISKFGERLDSVADIIFVIISILKIVPFLNFLFVTIVKFTTDVPLLSIVFTSKLFVALPINCTLFKSIFYIYILKSLMKFYSS